MTVSVLDNCTVAVATDRPVYNATPPYHPSERFPEWPGLAIGAEDNPGYRAVRNALRSLGMDPEHFDGPEWNPLGSIVKPGNTVMLKPNLVSHRNMGESWGLTDTDSLVTHGSVIRAVVDYAAKALKGRGRIIVGDCPVQGTVWDKVVALTRLDSIKAHCESQFPGIEFSARDYRLGTARVVNDRMLERTVRADALDDYFEVDLGKRSLLLPLMGDGVEFGVSQYPKHRMRRAHTAERNLYLFPKDIVKADVFINLPKLKTHMKAGVTIALKNLVGINGHKDYLPHFRYGNPKRGGDEYPASGWLWDLRNWIAHLEWERDNGAVKRALIYLGGACSLAYRKSAGLNRGDGSVDSGSWHGNDTLWRTVLDINRAFFYFDPEREQVTDHIFAGRRYLAIADGLIVGEKESPLCPSPRPCGVVIAGWNPVATDAVGCAVLGFDGHKIRQIAEAFRIEDLKLADFRPDDIRVKGLERIESVADIYSCGRFPRCIASRGMRGHVEYERRVDSRGAGSGREELRAEA